MWAAVAPALVGLLGVIVGAGITTGANYWLATRKEKADAERERLARANELRIAARLVEHEFAVARAGMAWFVEKRSWPPEKLHVASEAWQKYRDILARELPREDWDRVQLAGLAVLHFAAVFSGDSPSSNNFSNEIIERGNVVLQQIVAGLTVLRSRTENVV
jgi:hypothetical protein